MKLYGLKNCDNCRKALKSLNLDRVIDVREDGIPSAVLRLAVKRFDVGLVNKKSLSWRNLTESEREKPIMELLQTHPVVMKRPLIVLENEMYLGWGEETRTALGVA